MYVDSIRGIDSYVGVSIGSRDSIGSISSPYSLNQGLLYIRTACGFIQPGDLYSTVDLYRGEGGTGSGNYYSTLPTLQKVNLEQSQLCKRVI